MVVARVSQCCYATAVQVSKLCNSDGQEADGRLRRCLAGGPDFTDSDCPGPRVLCGKAGPSDLARCNLLYDGSATGCSMDDGSERERHRHVTPVRLEWLRVQQQRAVFADEHASLPIEELYHVTGDTKGTLFSHTSMLSICYTPGTS